ncbi:MAG: nickel-dependent lactate racemase [Anaerolineae bacterium]|jgi:nickel-dependent lactate racemase|nr:nickel-dependent lactate racemase [Chloroflexota bacterium]
MDVQLKYGRQGLTVSVPDDATVIYPVEAPGLPDETAALRAALQSPIGMPSLDRIVRPKDTVAIEFSDITRPMPSHRVLPVLLEQLERLVPREQILLINGTGTHVANTREELVGILGQEIVDNYRVVNHNAWDNDNLVNLGSTPRGHQVLVNKAFYQADVKILTGFIEPHIFAGFSGGPKGVLPAVAGIESIMDNHGVAMLADPRATWGNLEGNPVWEEMRAFATMARPDMILNVTLNRLGQLTGVFAGQMDLAHAHGVAFVKKHALVPVPHTYDVVLTTNSGYPLDINLYQTIKGISAARQAVKQGGSIIVASQCQGGIPDYGEYRNLVVEGGSPEGILTLISAPGFRRHDQWEAQLHANLMKAADIFVYSEGLSDEQVREMLFTPTHDIASTVRQELERHGPGASLLVIPEGSQSIPYVQA